MFIMANLGSVKLHLSSFLRTHFKMSQFIDCFSNYKEKCLPKYYFIKDSFPRHSPALVKVVELLGKGSFGKNAELKIVEIPDGIDYENEGTLVKNR